MSPTSPTSPLSPGFNVNRPAINTYLEQSRDSFKMTDGEIKAHVERLITNSKFPSKAKLGGYSPEVSPLLREGIKTDGV